MFSEIRCAKPSFNLGTVDPTTDTVAVDETYTVTCNSGSELAGTGNPIMTCTSTGELDQRPRCAGIHFIVLIVRILLANFTIVSQISKF